MLVVWRGLGKWREAVATEISDGTAVLIPRGGRIEGAYTRTWQWANREGNQRLQRPCRINDRILKYRLLEQQEQSKTNKL